MKFVSFLVKRFTIREHDTFFSSGIIHFPTRQREIC